MEVEHSKRRPWRIFARAKGEVVDLRLNAAIERVPACSFKLCMRFSFLLRPRRLFIAMKLEKHELKPIKSSKKSGIVRFFAKVFGRRGRLRWLRGNGAVPNSSEPSKPQAGFSKADEVPPFVKVLCSKVSQSRCSWMKWPAMFLLLLFFLCEWKALKHLSAFVAPAYFFAKRLVNYLIQRPTPLLQRMPFKEEFVSFLNQNS